MSLPPTYVVTLPQRRDRVVQHLNSQNIPHKVFPAMNGKQLGIKTEFPYLDDWGPSHWKPPYGNGDTDPFFCGAGIHALVLSNLAIIKSALAEGHEEILILEDDVVLVPDFTQKFGAFKKELPDNYGSAHLGYCCLDPNRVKPVSPLVSRGFPLCTEAMLFQKQTMKEIDEKISLWAPWDIFLFKKIFPADGTFLATPPLASQLSNIGQLPTTLS